MNMFQIEVKLGDDGETLFLTQEDNGEEVIIALHPDQVPIICEWMMLAIGAKTETRESTRFEN